MNSLLLAWETTVEDVENVLKAMEEDIALAPELFMDYVDVVAVAKAALASGVEMENQTAGAYAEIKRQIESALPKLLFNSL
jgi:hypothetical protein